MMTKNSKIKKILFFVLLAMVFALTSCRAGQVSGILGEGATEFADGKEEKDIPFLSSEEILEKMMTEYAGSRKNPDIADISDDDAKKKKEESEKDDTQLKDVYEIGSYDDLKQAILEALDVTATTFDYKLTGSYTISTADIMKFYDESYTADAYDTICIESTSHWDNGTNGEFFIDYELPVSDLKKMKEESRVLVKDAVSKIHPKDNSDYAIVEAVNDYLCDNVEYPASEPYAPEEHTGYNALKNQSAVCDGYSRAAKMLLNEMGVSCQIEVGDCLQGGGHAWNLVEVDGEWYQMDVTWNDGGQNYYKAGRKEYFLVTDAFMEKSRTWDTSLWPASSPVPYSK